MAGEALASAQSKVDAMFDAEEGNPAPVESVPEAPSQAEPAATPEVAPDDSNSVTYDYGGKQYQLTKDEAGQVAAYMHRMQEQERNAPAPAAAPEPPQQKTSGVPPQAEQLLNEYMSPHLAEIEQLKRRLEESENKALRTEITQELEAAYSKSAVKDLISDPEQETFAKGLAAVFIEKNPDMSTASAMKRVEKLLTGIAANAKTSLVTKKATAAVKGGAGGGGVAPSQKPDGPNRQSFQSGKVGDRILARFLGESRLNQ